MGYYSTGLGIVGADTVAPSAAASVEIADKANRLIASHEEPYIAIAISDDGDVRIVTAENREDSMLNDFYGSEVDKSSTRFAAVYGPAPEREELERYVRAKKAGTIVLYTKNPLVIGAGAGLVGLVIGLILKGRSK